MKMLVAVWLMLLSLSNCQHDTLRQKMIAKISESCKTFDACVIDLKEVGDFSWDKVYVFKTTATQKDIDMALGVHLPEYTEFSRKIVFLNKGKIISREDWPSNLERWEDGDVVFIDIPIDKVFMVFTPDKSRFRAVKKEIVNGTYYELTQQP